MCKCTTIPPRAKNLSSSFLPHGYNLKSVILKHVQKPAHFVIFLFHCGRQKQLIYVERNNDIIGE